MNKIWSFLGGALVGAMGIVTAALVVDKLDSGNGQSAKDGREEPLALPEGSNKSLKT